MIIGIEAERANSPHKTGVEHYAKQLILHLAGIDSVNRYVLYLRSQPEEWLKELPQNFHLRVMPFPLFWTQLRVSWEMWRRPVDVLLIPASALPIVHPKNSVVVIHDLAWEFFPQTFTWFNRHFLNWSTGFAARRAKTVIAVSESTKRDLQKFYSVKADKIKVVHHGYDPAVSQASAKLLNLPERYILFLSTLQPRKNLEGLIDAFVKLKKELLELPQKLVVVGRPGWKYQSIIDKISQAKNQVVYLNYLPDQQRAAALKHADLLVLPSFYEGFGMQILEAFAAGVPVATSNTSSMPEVAGEAAVYFNPHDQREIKAAIQNVLLDKNLSERLCAAGKERLKQFSWEQCARETLKILTDL